MDPQVEAEPSRPTPERSAQPTFAPPLSGGTSASSLLDAALERAASPMGRSVGVIQRFLQETSPEKALACWLGPTFPHRQPDFKRKVLEQLGRDVAHLDALLNRQVNAILHHPRFQKLEASWRGLHQLVMQTPDGAGIKIRVLNITWGELVKDLERALEFDQSQLFRKVYENEFGMPGGEPFGVLLGDYDIHLRPGPGHPTDDLTALRSIAAVSAAAFAPFIAAGHPSLLELNSFTELEKSIDLARTFEQTEYIKWKSLRQSEDVRFVGLTMPRVLMRLPYTDNSNRVDGFCFREDVSAPNRAGYLWGNAAYAYGTVLIRTFANHAWLAAIRGVRRGELAGGVVTGLPVHSFTTDKLGLARKTSTEVLITDALDKELGDLGFLPLCACPDTNLSAFYGSQSIQSPPVYDKMSATVNARLSAMLQYMFCVSRFAHYLKVIARDEVGSFTSPADCEEKLALWLRKYTNANDNAAADLKAKHPLREAKVQVVEVAGQPGKYTCIAHLRPHFQLDQLVSSVRLVTQIPGGAANS